MQRPLQRAQRRGHRIGQAGPGGRGDARGESRCVQPMIGRGHQVGVERGRLVRCRRRALQHAQEIRRVAGPRIGRDRRLAVADADRRGQPHRHRRSQQQRCVLGIVRHARQQQTHRRQRRQAAGARQQIAHPRKRALARQAQVAAQLGLGQRAIDEVLPQQSGQPLEAAPSRDVLQVMAAQDQHARFAIDLAQHGLRRDHILQSVGHIARLATRHVRSPWQVDAAMPYIESSLRQS